MDQRDFLDPGAEYRGVTLWMLNDELDPEELVRQLEGFRSAGWGALITRTFVGLRTEYLGDEWMRALDEIVRVSGELGIKVWLQAGYMPSAIPGLAPEMAHRVLARRPKDEPREDSETVLSEDGAHVYCERVMPHVLDLLSPEAVRDYLEKAYDVPWVGRFGKEFGRTIEAVWVDEPHFRPPLLPWSERLPARFEEKWGYDLTDHLPSLFSEVGDHRKVRHHYWRTVLEMFLEAYFDLVGRWCEEHGVKFSGHLMGEDTLNSQTAWTGAAMPCYEYMQLPGIDHLTMSLTWPTGKKFILPPKQCSSAAAQLGRDEVLAEMYGVSSQDITFEDRKQIGDWLAVLGVNYRCYHGSFYSMRGRRKRIYAPHLSYQQPWWPDNRLVADYFARLSYALRQGTHRADVLVVHPVESAFCLFDPTRMGRPHDRTAEPEDVKALDDCLVRLSENLLGIHRGFDYGDETILAKRGEVTADGLPLKINVGRMSYKAVVLPSLVTLRRTTVDLLERFAGAGGSVFSVGEMPSRVDGLEGAGLGPLENAVRRVGNSPAELKRALDECLPPEVEIVPLGEGRADTVWIHAREIDGDRLYFLVNTDRDETVEAELRMPGPGTLEYWDLATGRVEPLSAREEGGSVVAGLRFPPLASHLVLQRAGEAGEGPGTSEAREVGAKPRSVSRVQTVLDGARIRRHSPNALTLDRCRFRKGAGDWSGTLPVICVQAMLDREGYEGPVTLEFRFDAQTKPKSIAAVIEDAREFAIRVNGREVGMSPSGHYLDRSFHPVDVTEHVQVGENVMEVSREFRPVPKPKFALASLFETHSGVELESVYLTGEFAVKGSLSPGEEKPGCARYGPAFVLADEEGASGGDLLADGYPFFAGRISLLDTVSLERPRRGERVYLVLPGLHAALAKVRVNGREAGAAMWPPYEVDVTSLVEPGENEIDVELVSTLRNLLGPHHRPSGEPDECWGQDFDFDPDWLHSPQDREANWTDDYFFVNFGVTVGPARSGQQQGPPACAAADRHVPARSGQQQGPHVPARLEYRVAGS